MGTKHIGLVLGGGGARGLAHIGVLKVLEREKIPIHCISGTSMGGVLGALFAMGVPVAEMESEVQSLVKIRELVKLVDIGISKGGALKGERIYRYMAEKIGLERTFSELAIPLAVVTVDLYSGKEVVISEGRVVDAVRATISVPAVFTPVKMGQYRLIDGGVLNNVPVDVARSMGAEAVIAVDVLPHFEQNQPGEQPRVMPLQPRYTPRVYRHLWHIEMIMISALTEFRLREAKPEVILRPTLPLEMDLFIGFQRYQVAIDAGEQAAEAALPEIRALLSS
jgi:NTE family protein